MKALILAAALVAPLADPGQEARARALENEIRCVVCQNEPISQSTADMATDMRRLVRERIAAGESDAEIRAFFKARYGDFVLLRPGADPAFWGLWVAPFVLLLAGLAALFALRRGAAPLAPEPDDR